MKRKPDKHMPYFVVLEALRESRECPLCALESVCMSRYFDGLVYERVNDPGVRGDLARSKGFCHRHAHRLLECGDSFGTSILYVDHVRNFAHFIEDVGGRQDTLRLKDAKNWAVHEGCPACRLQMEDRERRVHMLLEGLSEPEMLHAFQESAGLCVPHFLIVMEAARDAETRRCIIEVMRDKYGALLADLSEFQRKREWQHAHEPLGKEGDSWARAVRMIVGGRGLF